MASIDQVFDRMDTWRHLPAYQLERRADLIFSLYIAQAIEAKFGVSVAPILIPEFPVRIGTIFPGISTNKSYKIDYVAFSSDGDEAFLVELKTESLSRRGSQDRYLQTAQRLEFPRLLEGILDIFRATNSFRKYYCLLLLLERAGQVRLPDSMQQIFAQDDLRGVLAASHQIQIASRVSRSRIIYVQPNGAGDDVIAFNELAETVRHHGDPLSQRFCQSLVEWADIPAGSRAGCS